MFSIFQENRVLQSVGFFFLIQILQIILEAHYAGKK